MVSSDDRGDIEHSCSPASRAKPERPLRAPRPARSSHRLAHSDVAGLQQPDGSPPPREDRPQDRRAQGRILDRLPAITTLVGVSTIAIYTPLCLGFAQAKTVIAKPIKTYGCAACWPSFRQDAHGLDHSKLPPAGPWPDRCGACGEASMLIARLARGLDLRRAV